MWHAIRRQLSVPDLAFEDEGDERAFKADMEATLVRYTGQICGVLLVVLGPGFAWFHDLVRKESATHDASTWLFRSGYFLVGSTAGMLMLCIAHATRDKPKINWELAVSTYIMVAIVSSSLCYPRFWCAVLQTDLQQEFGSFASFPWAQNVALGMDTLLTLAGFALPIRSNIYGLVCLVAMLTTPALLCCTSLFGAASGNPSRAELFAESSPALFIACLAPLAFYGAYLNEASRRTAWESHQQLATAKARIVELDSSHSLVCRKLLDKLCDAVLILASDFTITEASPNFAAMIARRQQEVKGQSILQFIDSEKQCSDLMEALNQDTEEISAGLIHLHLKDSFLQSFSVECFFASSSNRRQHILGITETSDRSMNPLLQDQVGHLPLFEGVGGERSRPRRSASNSSSSSSRSSSARSMNGSPPVTQRFLLARNSDPEVRSSAAASGAAPMAPDSSTFHAVLPNQIGNASAMAPAEVSLDGLWRREGGLDIPKLRKIWIRAATLITGHGSTGAGMLIHPPDEQNRFFIEDSGGYLCIQDGILLMVNGAGDTISYRRSL